MYSPLACAPNHHQITPVNATPHDTHTADSIAASLVVASCASRWKTSRSTSSIATISASSAPHCHRCTSSSTKFPSPLAAATTDVGNTMAAPISCRRRGSPARPKAGRSAPGTASTTRSRDRRCRTGRSMPVATVLTAHAELQPRLGRPATLGADPHEFTDAGLVDGVERIGLQQALLEVLRHHPALDVVTAESERQLREVVGAEAEEVRHLGDLVGTHRCTRRLDHRADGDGGLLLHPLQRRVDLGLHPAPGERHLLASR